MNVLDSDNLLNDNVDLLRDNVDLWRDNIDLLWLFLLNNKAFLCYWLIDICESYSKFIRLFERLRT